MVLKNHIFSTQEALKHFIKNEISPGKSVLVQLYCGELDKQKVQTVLDTVRTELPKATIIGSSTAGEIEAGKFQDHSILLSFSLFSSTTVSSLYFDRVDFQGGVMAEESIPAEAKAIIAFSEALKQDPESFLQGLHAHRKDLVVAGGIAGDNYRFEETFVIEGGTIHTDGMVMAVLTGADLIVHSGHSLEWHPIGKTMVVTSVKGGCVYTLDHRPVSEVYRRYFGEEFVAALPASSIEFPLVKTEREALVARTMIAVCNDGGYRYAGHFHVGEKVRFAIGDVEEILENAVKLGRAIASVPVEAVYVYSCSARKRFMKEELNNELALLEHVAPIAGFFTYGEFLYTQNQLNLLNVTMTTLAISESSTSLHDAPISSPKDGASTIKPLTHLVSVSEGELEQAVLRMQQYRVILDESAIVSKTDRNGVITEANDAFCRISGYSLTELLGQTHNIIRHPETPAALYKKMWQELLSKQTFKATIKNQRKDGSVYWVKTVIMPLLDHRGEIEGFISARTDVTDIVKKDALIRRQYRDALTGLGNRTALLDNLSIASEDNATLILIDIDRFSDINDYYGYRVGDRVLQIIANLIQHEYELAFRISGDEFAILCEHGLDEEKRRSIMQLIARLENEKYSVGSNEISLFVDCGVANGSKDQIYALAHITLKACKRSHKAVIFYNDRVDLQIRMQEGMEMASCIRSALANSRIVPFFQGIVDNQSRKIVKYEALVRMLRPNEEILTPSLFLEHSKRARLYPKVISTMIEQTFFRFADEDYSFSINLSMQDIESESVLGTLFGQLEHYRCGERVVLEIVESEGIENFEQVQNFIRRVKAYGCKIAIDDFGSGYSNFVYLTKLHVDFIKIDGSLIKGIEEDPVKRVTVEAILKFAKSMKIQTIAEFVETEEDFAILRTIGVDFSQGYLFSKPSMALLT